MRACGLFFLGFFPFFSLVAISPAYSQSVSHLVSKTDFDGDGLSDLAVFDPATRQFRIRLSSTLEIETRSAGDSGSFPVTGDFDGDGITDIGGFDRTTATWTIEVGDNRIVLPYGNAGDLPVNADYAGNGCDDIAMYNPKRSDWTIANCKEPVSLSFRLGQPGSTPVPADVNGDGKVDAGVYHPPTSFWTYRLSGSDETVEFFYGLPGDIPFAADFNGDGKAQACVYRPTTNEFYVRNADGKSGPPFAFGLPADQPFLVDVDGDGRADFAVRRPSDNTFYVFTATGVFFQIPFSPSSSSRQRDSRLTSFACDVPGFEELFPDGTLSFPFNIPLADVPPEFCDQIIALFESIGLGGMPTPTPAEAPALHSGFPVTAHPSALSIRRVKGDYDGDGTSDIVSVQYRNGLFHWIMHLAGGKKATVNHGRQTDVLVPADYLGLRSNQPAVVRKNAQTGFLDWYVRSPDGSSTVETYGMHGDSVLAKDFDCDGKADKAIVRKGNPFLIWYIKLSTGQQVVTRQFGLVGDKVYAGDINGDGCDEMIVSRSISGLVYWFVYDLDTWAVTQVQWGVDGDKLLPPADMNGDGIDEFIVTRKFAAGLVTFVRYSDSNFDIIPHGLAQNVPLTGDFSGVNKGEVAVYQAAAGLRNPGKVVVRGYSGLLKEIQVSTFAEHVILPSGAVISTQEIFNGESSGDILECNKKTNFKDGNGGALWKPVSDNSGNPVILLPASYWTRIKKIEIFGIDGGVVKKILDGKKRRCCPNGNRAHYDVPMRASKLARYKPITVRFTMNGGYKECRDVPDPRRRYD